MNRLPRPMLIASALVALIVAACASPKAPPATPALSRANLDTTCAPCTDFYEYANGGWLKRDTIPSAYPSYGAFFAVQDHNWDVLHQILDRDAKDAADGKVAAGSAAVEGRDVLRELHGHGGDRQAGTRAAATGARHHRRHSETE